MKRLCVLVCATLATSQAMAGSVTISSSNHDNTIFSGGTTNSLGAGIGMFAGTDANGASGVKRGLVSFDIKDNVPAGSTIQSVTLTLTLAQVAGAGSNFTGGDATPREIDLHRVTASWGEGTAGSGQPITADGQGFAAGNGDATWTDRSFSPSTPVAWTNAGGDFAAAVSAAQTVGNPHNNTTQFTWSGAGMVADVQAWLNGADANNFGWILINTDETDAKTFRAFFTREQGGLTAPTLAITYLPAPEPNTALLAAIGVLVAAIQRIRSNRG